MILVLIVVVSTGNFRVSLRRARDADRKQAIGAMVTALTKYHEDFGFFPPATEDGRIVACKDEFGPIQLEGDVDETLEERLLKIFRPCEWGEDSLRDVTDPDYPPYFRTLPEDPRHEDGFSYYYQSNTNRFQVYTSLEGEDEDEYTPTIEEKGFMCGSYTCNFGKASGSTPLDKTIREYENELKEKAK